MTAIDVAARDAAERGMTVRALAERELYAGIHTATYGAHGGTFGSLWMLADAGRTIADALTVLCPVQDGDSPEWTLMLKRTELAIGLTRARPVGTCWDIDTINQACTTAMRITAGKIR